MAGDSNLRDYLIAPPDSFWEWLDGGEVVAWKGGTTIAFRDELRAVFTWLAPQGLPSLDSIALLLSATHESWNANGWHEAVLEKLVRNVAENAISDLRRVIAGLDKIRNLPPELRTSLRAKAVLAELVLGACRKAAPPEVAMEVVEAMYRGLGELIDPQEADLEMRGYGPLLLWRDLMDMKFGLARIDVELLQVLLATGLDELPKSAEVDLPPSKVARALLSSLKDDVELAGLANVAEQLLAAASLPRRLEAHEQHQTGGFSDISNRGTPERLLISELANDDLTLAVRVAMNEALYLHREIPRSNPHHHRAVLIDMGIRSWGLPRVFATAVALALMASTAKGGSYTCFRAKRQSAVKANLATRDGLVEHLGVLETELHPAEAIPSFLKQVEGDRWAEPILLMSEESFADAAVQASLRQAELPQLFIATVNREGVFRLAERGRYGTKPLREARIELGDLFREPASLQNNRLLPELPAIFSVEPFPLLLSHSIDWGQAHWVENWGVLTATTDGRLLRWERSGYGARQLSDNITGKILWVAPGDVGGHVTLVVGNSSKQVLMRISDENQVVDRIPLRTRFAGMRFCGRNGVLFFIRERSVDVLDMHTGEIIETITLPGGVAWKRDRFFFGISPTAWYALTHDGESGRLERVESAGDDHKLPPLITMFDVAGLDGPIGVTTEGELFSTATGNVRHLRHDLKWPLAVPWISADGCRLQIRSRGNTGPDHRSAIINTENLNVTVTYHAAIDDRAQRLVQMANMRHRFQAIGIDPDGNLALVTRKEHLLTFRVRHNLAAPSSKSTLRARRAFEPFEDFDRRYKLWSASWPDGSRAMLDSRGLLHLTSSDESIPAVTLVLAEGELSGWTSNGQLFGKRYFTDNRAHEAMASGKSASLHASVRFFVEHLDA